MRKKLSLVIMFLLTFFSFAFLGTTELKATTETVSYDLSAINVPTTAIASFPVTHKSVHGNTITWEVQEGQEVISYDAEAHWMVVSRPSEGEATTVEITVTVTDGANTESKVFNVVVPSGKTATPVYTIEYTLDGGTLESPKSEYRLGEASFTLPTPTKEGYTFEGWYENDTKIEKVLVGTSRNLTLTAHWTKNAVSLENVEVSLEDNEVTYTASEIEVVVNAVDGEATLVKDTHYTVSYKLGETTVDSVVNAGTYTVVVTAKENSGYTGSKELTLTVNKAQLTLTPSSKSIHVGSSMPSWVESEFTLEGKLGEDTVNVDYNSVLQTVKDSEDKVVTDTQKAGTYTVEFNGITIDNPNYELTVEKARLEIIATNIKVELSFTEVAYDGTKHQPIVTITDDETLLTVNVDYTLTYPEDMISAGTKTITITGIGSYEGTEFGDVTYKITKKVVELTANDVEYTYGDTPETNGYTVTDGSLSEEEKETLGINVAIEEGKVKISYTENANYDITCIDGALIVSKRSITVTADSLSSVYGENIKELTFKVTGYEAISGADLEELKGLISLTKEEGTDVNTYVITVKYASETESDKFNITFANGTYTINQLDLSEKATIELKGNDYNIYNGNVKPEVTVKYNGETIDSTSYTVAYANTDKAGTATVTVTFSGNYTGEVTKDYTITANGQAELDKAALVESLKDTLTGTVTELGNLPLIQGSSTITWTSDSTAVSIDSTTGKVTLVRGTEDLEVTLTASVTCGTTSSDIASFTITIAKEEVVEKFTVTFNSNEGSQVASEEVENGQKVTKPTDPTRTGYVFKGWFTDDSDFTDEWDFDADTVTNDITLYAKWEEESKPAASWKLVTNASELKAGDQIIIVAKDEDKALGTTQGNNNRSAADITKTSILITDDIQVITLENGKKDNTFAFNVRTGYLYAASMKSNHLKTETTLSDNSSWDITITAEGVATIKAQGTNSRNLLKYNKSSTLFSCYASGQKDVCIYKLS